MKKRPAAELNRRRAEKEDFTHHDIYMSVADFILSYSTFDVQPVGQRLDTEPKLESGKTVTKAQGIINNLLLGINLGTLTIREVKGKFKYESIDGGHRKRFLKLFFENKFRVNGKFFSELTDDERTTFLTRKLHFVVYTNLSFWGVGYIFRSVNETTPVNHQEMLNSYGDIPIANAIRNTCRPVVGINNVYHKLFEFTENKLGRSYTQLQFDNHRLNIDEIVARLFYRYYDGGGLGRSDESALEEMYEAELDQVQVDEIASKVNSCLDFLYKISVARKSRTDNGGRRTSNKGLSAREFSVFSRIWLYMEETYGEFKINDIHEFYVSVATQLAVFFQPLESLPAELKAESEYDATKNLAQQFISTLREYRHPVIILTTLNWLLERIDMRSLVTIKDPRRFFSQAYRENMLAQQGFKCAIDGKPLTMKDAQGDHIITHCDGGRTTYDNLMMISTEHNQRKGSMSLEKYKELLAITAE